MQGISFTYLFSVLILSIKIIYVDVFKFGWEFWRIYSSSNFKWEKKFHQEFKHLMELVFSEEFDSLDRLDFENLIYFYEEI